MLSLFTSCLSALGFGRRRRTDRRPSPRRGTLGRGWQPLEERRLLIAGGADSAGSVERQFVMELYENVLHRTPAQIDQASVDNILDQVDAGVPIESFITMFLTSAEYNVNQVIQDYNQYLGRPPEPAAISSWQTALASGLPEEQLADTLLASTEYYVKQGASDTGFVTGLYHDVLDRAAPAGDITYWDNQLLGGETRSAVAASFLNSIEHLDSVVNSEYQNYLNRPAEPAALAYWSNNLAGGGSLISFQQTLLLARLGPEGYSYTDPLSGGLTPIEVQQLLNRAQAASARQDAIIAITDQNGNILGVRVEQQVTDMYAGRPNDLNFAIDGAVSLARTGAFFSSNAGALTSRTVRFLSQSTIIEREVNSNPNGTDPNSPILGPGFVAPIGLGAHFPPGVSFTPPVDLFGIENTNRDSLIHPDVNGIKYAGDPGMVVLQNRFNVPSQYIAPGQNLATPESYGYVTGTAMYDQSRGIATLPGGIPLYAIGAGGAPTLVGGIGVFFPGPFGYASYEQNYIDGQNQSATQLTNAPLALEAEWMAFAAAAGDFPNLAGSMAPNGLSLPRAGNIGFGVLYQEQINLVGVQVEAFGPNPTNGQLGGIDAVLQVGAISGRSTPMPSEDKPIDKTGTRLYGASRPVPTGWIVLPHASADGSITQADVINMITQGVVQAQQTRAAIRQAVIPGNVNLSPGPRAEMILAVGDEQGNILGLYRMPDATVFSLDVAVAKARNVAYFSNANQLQPIDQYDPLSKSLVLPPGVAYTNRTFRFLAGPRFPDGIDGTPPGPFSILWDPGTNPSNGAEIDPANPVPASAFQTVLGYDAFHPGTNFRDKSTPLANQNGVVFFPGSAPVYKNGVLVGGLGVSGDGVDQDDVVTAYGAVGYGVPANIGSADDVFVRGVRLPYQNYNRNPDG
ncbi:MAG TPA: DUF4214 domain-containing protein [Pirellulales bacterium]